MRGAEVLYCDGSLKWFAVHMVLAEMLSGKLLSTQVAGMKNLFFSYARICTSHDMMEITNGQTWQNSLLWRGAR
jgi:hypothetical protein